MKTIAIGVLTFHAHGQQDVSTKTQTPAVDISRGANKLMRDVGMKEHSEALTNILNNHSETIHATLEELGLKSLLENHGATISNLWNSHGRRLVGGKNFGKVFSNLPPDVRQHGATLTNILSEVAAHPLGMEQFFVDGQFHVDNIHDLLHRHDLAGHIEHWGGAHGIHESINKLVGEHHEPGSLKSLVGDIDNAQFYMDEGMVEEFIKHHRIEGTQIHDHIENNGGAQAIAALFNDHVFKTITHFNEGEHASGVMQVINSMQEYGQGGSITQMLSKGGMNAVKGIVQGAADGDLHQVVGGFTQFFVDPITGQVVGVHGQPKIEMGLYNNPSIFNPSLEMHQNLVRMLKEQSKGGANADSMKRQIDDLYAMFGDHSGNFGTSGGFDVRLDEDSVHVEGVLPGDWSDGTSPTVDLLGGSLVIQGKSDFHRVFNMPSNIKKNVQVQFASKSGKLGVVVPRDRSMPSQIEGSDDFAGDDFVAPTVRAMHESLEEFKVDLEKILRSSGGNKNKLAQKLRSQKKQMEKELDLAKQLVDKLTEYHGPDGSYALPHPAPHRETVTDNEVEYAGCYQTEQLPDDKQKGPQSLHAGDFNLVFDHMAEASYLPQKPSFFALARHGAPINSGDIWSFNVLPTGTPLSEEKCGSACADDSNRSCGCMDKKDREKGTVFTNNDCGGQTKFAVYKIKNRSVPAAVESQKDLAEQEATNWRLQRDPNGTFLEMVVPAAAASYKIDNRLMVIFGAKNKHGEDEAISKLHIPFEVESKECNFLTVHGDTHHVIRCKIPPAQLSPAQVVVRDEF